MVGEEIKYQTERQKILTPNLYDYQEEEITQAINWCKTCLAGLYDWKSWAAKPWLCSLAETY